MPEINNLVFISRIIFLEIYNLVVVVSGIFLIEINDLIIPKLRYAASREGLAFRNILEEVSLGHEDSAQDP